MPPWITSLLRDETPLPMPAVASATITPWPRSAIARAAARPTPPAPLTRHSTLRKPHGARGRDHPVAAQRHRPGDGKADNPGPDDENIHPVKTSRRNGGPESAVGW